MLIKIYKVSCSIFKNLTISISDDQFTSKEFACLLPKTDPLLAVVFSTTHCNQVACSNLELDYYSSESTQPPIPPGRYMQRRVVGEVSWSIAHTFAGSEPWKRR